MEKGNVLVCFVLVSMEMLISTSASSLINICDTTEEISLADVGLDSYQTIDLNPSDPNRNTPCTLIINASSTHLLHLRFQETDLELHRMMPSSRRQSRPCNLQIYLQDFEDKFLWSGDICSLDKLPDVDLLPPKIKLVWSPADSTLHSKGRKISINTVGTGNFCKRTDQHVCMKMGWKPFCVSGELICDKREDCPRGSTKSDEDEKFCKDYIKDQSSWRHVVVKLYKNAKQHPDIDKIMEMLELTSYAPPHASQPDTKKVSQWKNWKEVHHVEVTTSVPLPPPPKTLLGFLISQYGPWGYFLIGVLLFGTTFVFWGMWECCIRKHKPEHHAIAAAQMGANAPTTTLLIVNGYEDAQGAQQPPEYEDLDLPPSYATLFPHEDKASEDEGDDDGETIPLDSIRIAGTSEERDENT